MGERWLKWRSADWHRLGHQSPWRGGQGGDRAWWVGGGRGAAGGGWGIGVSVWRVRGSWQCESESSERERGAGARGIFWIRQ
jgi:hypothetical protein